MSGKIIGYVRVSSYDQNPERQLEGVPLDKIFTDKASGKDLKRPAFQELLDYVREGDTVMVHSLDRLARNLDHLRHVINVLTQKGVRIDFVQEKLVFTDEDSPLSHLLLSVMGAFAEFERSLIRERQLEGIAIARQKGLYKGRRKALNEAQAKELRERVLQGEKKSILAQRFNISRETLYQYLKLSDRLVIA
ncbi:MAG: recombinase family protein [Caedimonas sp.]|nr:recombinase family protein [Caedimonas sp.]